MATSYRNAFYAALGLHGFIAVLFMVETRVSTPVMVQASREKAGHVQSAERTAESAPKVVQAVSVDASAVAETVNRLREARAAATRNEQQRQQALQKQATQLRQARVQEQQRLTALKEETEKLALLKKKQQLEETQRARQMALQKEKEIQQLTALKQQQQALETQQKKAAEALAVLKNRQKQETEQRNQAKTEQEKRLQQAQRAAEAETQARAHAAAAQQARRDAADEALMAGEIDKYKAMILSAISQKWILPEHLNRGLSSQFRIRLAPDGAVLEVTLIQGSGDPVLDRSAQTAIYRASPLPVPQDAHTFNVFRDIRLTVRPDTVRG